MSLVIGEGRIPEAASVCDVRDAITQSDVVLLAHAAKFVGESIPEGSTVYNLEPLFDGCRSLSLGYLDVLRSFKVWDYQRANVDYLAAHDIQATYVPWGYTQAMERVKSAPKDIDCLFIGSMSPRRERILAEISRSCKLITAQGVYGDELDRLIARAHVIVNVHYCDEPHPLEVVRLNYLMANGCIVVSELGWDDADNLAYDNGLCFSRRLAADCDDMVAEVKSSPPIALSLAARETIRQMPFKVPQ